MTGLDSGSSSSVYSQLAQPATRADHACTLSSCQLPQLSCVCKYSCYEQLTAKLPGLARQAVGSDMLDLETMPCNCQAAGQLSLAHSCHQLSAVAVTHHWHPALCSYREHFGDGSNIDWERNLDSDLGPTLPVIPR